MADHDATPRADSIAVLKDALAEAQMTVRAYDTKAQIVGVGYIFALNIVMRLENLFDKTGDVDLTRIGITWVVVIAPIILFGFVLYPSRRSIAKTRQASQAPVQNLLYVRSDEIRTADELRRAALSVSYIDELAFEVMSVSGLRDLKRQRFLRALFAAGLSFLVIFLSQMFRATAL